MEKYAILLGFFDKQLALIQRLFNEISQVDVRVYEKKYLFAMKTQQFYTAVEDLFKQIAKAFENHLDDLSSYHKELLVRLNTEIPSIRPAVISRDTFLFLDKVRAFRRFIRHAYDCELEESELLIIQERLKNEYLLLINDLRIFREYVTDLGAP